MLILCETTLTLDSRRKVCYTFIFEGERNADKGLQKEEGGSSSSGTLFHVDYWGGLAALRWKVPLTARRTTKVVFFIASEGRWEMGNKS